MTYTLLMLSDASGEIIQDRLEKLNIWTAADRIGRTVAMKALGF